MSTGRSFTDYVSSRVYNDLFTVVNSYVEENYVCSTWRSYAVKYIDSAVLSDVTIKRAYVDVHEDMRMAFEVTLDSETKIYEIDRDNDNPDTCSQWLLVKCEADLARQLDDFRIPGVSPYMSICFDGIPCEKRSTLLWQSRMGICRFSSSY